ncbi:hypothetical protein QZM26_06240, partial [Burkholderia multivorans]|nr:hypothetical protein [Burkholderia multivorans]
QCPKFVINDWLTHLLGPSVTMAKVNRMLKKLTALGLFLKPSLNHALADSIAELRGSAALRAPDHPAPVSRDTAEPEPECAAEMAARSCAVDSKRPRTAESDEIIDELREQVSTLADELEEVRGELDAYRAAESGQGEAKLIEANKEIARLKGEIRRLQDRRDDLMNENAELKREVKRLRKQLGYRANG